MSDLDVKSISLFGMEYQRARLEAASLNIANGQTFASSKSAAFNPVSAIVDIDNLNFAQYLQQGNSVSIVPNLASEAKAVHKPEHPLANDSGYVFLPQINLAEEMITLNSAVRAYEANVKAFNAYKEMGAKALAIGK